MLELKGFQWISTHRHYIFVYDALAGGMLAKLSGEKNLTWTQGGSACLPQNNHHEAALTRTWSTIGQIVIHCQSAVHHYHGSSSPLRSHWLYLLIINHWPSINHSFTIHQPSLTPLLVHHLSHWSTVQAADLRANLIVMGSAAGLLEHVMQDSANRRGGQKV